MSAAELRRLDAQSALRQPAPAPTSAQRFSAAGSSFSLTEPFVTRPPAEEETAPTIPGGGTLTTEPVTGGSVLGGGPTGLQSGGAPGPIDISQGGGALPLGLTEDQIIGFDITEPIGLNIDPQLNDPDPPHTLLPGRPAPAPAPVLAPQPAPNPISPVVDEPSLLSRLERIQRRTLLSQP
jgi:hypothetical protein